MRIRSKVKKTIQGYYYKILGYYPTTIEELKYKCDPYHLSFWKAAAKGQWEPSTYKILSKFLTSETIYCDIGTWIGPTVISAAKKCKKVYCFEPDPAAYRHLLWNIQLNKLHNVMPSNLALTSENGIQTMASFGSDLGDSMTSLINPDTTKKTTQVFCITWDSWTNLFKIEDIDFMKIDIEGGEFDFIPSIKNYLLSVKPTIYLSLHTPFIAKDKRIDNIKNIIDVMSIYRHCYNEDLVKIDINDLLSDKYLSTFNSFLFTDKP